jgi:ABC-type sugar transport system ATPase subunit
MTATIQADPPLWALTGITKRFPGVRANDGVNLTLRAGQIHGLLGENGCGKSTLIKILSGVQAPDEGEIRKDGHLVSLGSPTDARRAGVATVYQEFSLVPQLTVAENIFLGRHPRRIGLVDWGKVRRAATEILHQLDLDLDPDVKVGELSVAEQQLVEIAKALSQNAELLILDEPTTALGQGEVATLHGFLHRMAERGVSILYVSHRLDEVVDLVDDFTILKDGRVISRPGEIQKDVHEIVTRMIGSDVAEHFPKEHNGTDEVVLEVRGVSTADRIRRASFDLRKGEVLGLGGVIGSGRTEIARAIFGADRITEGEIVLHGRPLHLRSPHDAIRAGIALAPENRKSEGLFFNFSGGPNLTIANLRGIAPRLLLNHRIEREITRDYIHDLEITPAASSKPVNLISGGNQQKVLIARWLFSKAQIVIFDEPTQGIDVGARLAVYRLINDLTRSGKSVILISSAHDELLAMSDRVALVRHGTVTAVKPVGEIRHADLVSAAEAEHLSTTHPESHSA